MKITATCDSLLNLALNYYDNDEKERAVALLYKGRLEIEINSTKEAIAHLQEALTILKKLSKRNRDQTAYAQFVRKYILQNKLL